MEGDLCGITSLTGDQKNLWDSQHIQIDIRDLLTIRIEGGLGRNLCPLYDFGRNQRSLILYPDSFAAANQQIIPVVAEFQMIDIQWRALSLEGHIGHGGCVE